MNSVCLIGGSGFIGSHVARRLSARGVFLRIPTRNRELAKNDLILLPTAEVLRADVHDPNTLTELMRGCDTVINFVGVLNDSRKDGFRRNHVEQPQKLVNACREAGVGRLIHVSAIGADAQGPSRYMRSKAEGEAVIQSAAQHGIRTTIVRPSIVFGRGEAFLTMFAELARLFPVLPLGCPNAKFQPIYVEDVARAVVTCLDNDETVGQTYNLCGPKVYTLLELVRYVCAVIGKDPWIIPLPKSLSYLQAAVLEHLPGKVVTRDNFRSMQVDNVCGGAFPAVFGFTPTPMEAIAPMYLTERTPRGRYRGYRYRAGR